MAEEAMEVEESLRGIEMRECDELQRVELSKEGAASDPSKEVAELPRALYRSPSFLLY